MASVRVCAHRSHGPTELTASLLLIIFPPTQNQQSSGAKIPLLQDPNQRKSASSERRGCIVYGCPTSRVNEEHKCPLHLVFRSKPPAKPKPGSAPKGKENSSSGEGGAAGASAGVSNERGTKPLHDDEGPRWILDSTASHFFHAPSCCMVWDDYLATCARARKTPIQSRHNKTAIVRAWDGWSCPIELRPHI